MNGKVMALVALAMVAGALIWWFRRVGRVQIPKNRAPFIVWMLAGGVLASLALALGGGWLTILPAVVAIVGALFAVFTASISRQKVEGAIDVGDPMPTFEALDEDGATFESSSLAGGPVLLKFFRGHW